MFEKMFLNSNRIEMDERVKNALAVKLFSPQPIEVKYNINYNQPIVTWKNVFTLAWRYFL